jgi:pimeloyl-ACP methyl ester carboxylesterase
MRCVALDLPGFGDRRADEFGDSRADEFSNDRAVQQIVATIRELRGESSAPWLLAGHSMGGKLAALVARQAACGAPGLERLSGLILVSPSPASPEPIKESKRAELLRTLGTGSDHDEEIAGKFVDDNVGKLALEPALRQSAVSDLLRMDRRAFAAWLTDASKEDRSREAGVLPFPALILAGSEEPELGPETQRRLTAPHFASAIVAELQGSGHLAPLERPAEVADRITAFVRDLGLHRATPQRLSGEFLQLLQSDATSPQTRAVMQRRLEPESAASLFTPEERLTLAALVRRVVPDATFNLAARVEHWLADGSRDGWRFDTLPPDAEAWKQGLASLDHAATGQHGVPFPALHAAHQDALLTAAREGRLGPDLLGKLGLGAAAGSFSATQMQQWFEDVRGALARLYIGDPRTMDRIGFTGFADQSGFTHIRLGDNQTA